LLIGRDTDVESPASIWVSWKLMVKAMWYTMLYRNYVWELTQCNRQVNRFILHHPFMCFIRCLFYWHLHNCIISVYSYITAYFSLEVLLSGWMLHLYVMLCLILMWHWTVLSPLESF
jgi:hypothetical protein